MPKFVSSNGCEAGENVFIWHIITIATESTIRCVEVRAEGAALLIITKYEVTLQMGLELPNRFSELPRDHIFGKWTPLTPALSYDQVLKKAETNGQCIRATFCILILGSIVKTLKHWGNLIFWHLRRCNIKFTFEHNRFKMPFFCHF